MSLQESVSKTPHARHDREHAWNENGDATFHPRLTNEPVSAARRRCPDKGLQAIVKLRPERFTTMMTKDETDRNRRPDESAEGSWYYVERVDPALTSLGTTLACHIRGRLRIIYSVPRTANEPAAVRQLLQELEAKCAAQARATPYIWLSDT